MKKTILALALIAGAFALNAAGTDVIVAGFEEAKLPDNIKGVPFLASADGGQEQNIDDTLTLELNNNASFVKAGAQSLKVTYKMNPVSASKFANLGFPSKDTMGGNGTLSFWINKVSGKPTITVAIFDSNWKKGLAKPVTLADGAKVYTFTAADFSKGFDWTKVNNVQITVNGEAQLYIDDIKFTK
jgi:hypothetical protein